MKPARLVLYIYYHKDENIFVDEDGHVIYDIFTVITPIDLFLFRRDPGFSCFHMVGKSDILCEIITIPDDVRGLDMDTYHRFCAESDLYFGEDHERNHRFEEAKSSGCFW